MKAPSVQLLRALRTTTNAPFYLSASSTARRSCQQALRLRASHYSLVPTHRALATSSPLHNAARAPNKYAPKSRDRGPKSTEDTQTDFGVMDVLGNIPAPATSVDACTTDGFHLDNGVKTEGGSGVCLVGGEAFTWEPWRALTSSSNTEPHTGDLLDARKGLLTIPTESLGLLELLHPKPDLLLVGTGGKLWMLSPETRRYVSEVLGCRLDVMDTANAAAAYNLLAKERGVEGGAGVGALLLPIGWVGPKPRVVRGR